MDNFIYLSLFLLNMKYLIPIIILLLITQVSAQVILGNDLQELKTQYNNNLDKVPWIAKKIIGNERINLFLTTNTGEVIIIGGVTKSAKILQIQQSKIDNPTLNIYITENTINRLKNKQVTIQQALKTKEISYKSQRIRTSIKSWFGRRLLTITSWF